MRSGSTLLGDILQHHSNSFYAFEPLRYIDEDVNKGKNISFFNGTTRYLNISDVTTIHAEMVYRWLTCDFDNINIKDIQSRFIGTFSHNLSKYAKCLKTQLLSINICITILRNQCHNATVRIVKTIRMKMESAIMLMKWLPELRIIHLLRDPRGKMASELGARMSAVLSFVGFATRTCEGITTDTRVTDYLRTLYPNRIRVLLYEKLATTPIETTKNIYNFLNMEFSNSTIGLVREFTQSGGSDDCTWCTKRTNSRSRAYLWRSTIDLGLVALIDRQCYFLYRKVGYISIFPPEEIRNVAKPLIAQTSFTNGAL
ncbi:uncharacterized protein LOC110456049 isoform X2 [Mizuhopecten yessoensis]|nr:uncharacterized protein LOC110456049 isoform X2 [Mizuhopecten yessoensis]